MVKSSSSLCKEKIQWEIAGLPKDIYAAVDSLVGNQNGNVVAARAKKNGNGNNANQIRCYNCRGMGHYARNCTTRLRRKDQASTSGTHADKAPLYDSDGSTELLESTIKTYFAQHNDSNVIPADSSMDPSGGDYEQRPATI
ncbi:integrase, catalytic region, zinc finger, CCHC-type containing protein [Tanacetum coccineum]